MLSVNVYDLIQVSEVHHKKIENFNDVVKEVINDYEEELRTMMEVEQNPFGKYRGFSIVTDKVYNQTVRVKGGWFAPLFLRKFIELISKRKI